MPYSVEADCRLYAPQAATGYTFASWITQADGVIDAKLRSLFTVPLATTPQIVKNISSKLAAGRYLEAAYSNVNAEPPAYARTLINEALKDLQELVDNPALLGITPRVTEVGDFDTNPILTSPSSGGLFDTNDPRGWRP